jgi:hypothetical protein
MVLSIPFIQTATRLSGLRALVIRIAAMGPRSIPINNISENASFNKCPPNTAINRATHTA